MIPGIATMYLQFPGISPFYQNQRDGLVVGIGPRTDPVRANPATCPENRPVTIPIWFMVPMKPVRDASAGVDLATTDKKGGTKQTANPDDTPATSLQSRQSAFAPSS